MRYWIISCKRFFYLLNAEEMRRESEHLHQEFLTFTFCSFFCILMFLIKAESIDGPTVNWYNQVNDCLKVLDSWVAILIFLTCWEENFCQIFCVNVKMIFKRNWKRFELDLIFFLSHNLRFKEKKRKGQVFFSQNWFWKLFSSQKLFKFEGNSLLFLMKISLVCGFYRVILISAKLVLLNYFERHKIQKLNLVWSDEMWIEDEQKFKLWKPSKWKKSWLKLFENFCLKT